MVSTITDRAYGESSGVAVKAPCAAVASLPISLSGLGSIGGYAPSEGDRILVTGQGDPTTNGIYNADVNTWQRAGDFDGSYDCVQGTLVVVFYPNAAGLIFQLTTANPIIGTTPLTFSTFANLNPNAYFPPPTPAEVAAGVIVVNQQYPPGQLDRYLTNAIPGTTPMDAALTAAIAQAQQPTGASVLIGNAYALGASATVPYGVSIECLDSGYLSIGAGQTLTIDGVFRAPRTQIFTGAGAVIFKPGSVIEAYPEWWGAVPNSIPASLGTDCTAAFIAMITACSQGSVALGPGVGVIPCRLGSGYYVVGNLTLTPAFTMRGTGRKNSGLIAKSGTTGTWITDNGNAAGIILEDFACWGNSANCQLLQYGIRIGYAIQHGSEGYIRGLWIRDVMGYSNGFALDINGNVGFYQLISIYGPSAPIAGCSLFRLAGSANYAMQLALVGCGANAYGLYESNAGGKISQVEIEAPGTCNSSFAPLSINASSFHDGIIISLAGGTSFDHLVEIGASAFYGDLEIAYFNSSAVAVAGGNILNISKGIYFGGNCGGSSNNPGDGTRFMAWPSGNALSGVATFAAATTFVVVLPFPQGDANYKVALSQSASSALPPWWSAKGANGFTINFSANFTGSVDWSVTFD